MKVLHKVPVQLILLRPSYVCQISPAADAVSATEIVEAFLLIGLRNPHVTDESPSLSIAAAVFAGAVILVGLPVMALTMALFAEVFVVFGVEDALGSADTINAVVFLTVLISAVLIGLQTAYEAAALQLHGIEALNRGSRLAVLARHVLLSLGVLAALAGATWIGLSAVLETESLWLAAPGALLAIAVVAVVLRSAGAFTDSYRGEKRTH